MITSELSVKRRTFLLNRQSENSAFPIQAFVNGMNVNQVFGKYRKQQIILEYPWNICCQTRRRRVEMNDSKEEIENLRKQINRLKISLMFTQISTIMVTIILGYQCLRSIQNYHYLLQQVSMCLEYVNAVYSALRQFLLTIQVRR